MTEMFIVGTGIRTFRIEALSPEIAIASLKYTIHCGAFSTPTPRSACRWSKRWTKSDWISWSWTSNAPASSPVSWRASIRNQLRLSWRPNSGTSFR